MFEVCAIRLAVRTSHRDKYLSEKKTFYYCNECRVRVANTLLGDVFRGILWSVWWVHPVSAGDKVLALPPDCAGDKVLGLPPDCVMVITQ